MKYSVEIEDIGNGEIATRYRGVDPTSPETRKLVAQDLRDAAALLEDESYPVRRIDN